MKKVPEHGLDKQMKCSLLTRLHKHIISVAKRQRSAEVRGVGVKAEVCAFSIVAPIIYAQLLPSVLCRGGHPGVKVVPVSLADGLELSG